MKTYRLLCIVAILTGLAVLAGVAADIPAGTVIPVVLMDQLSSSKVKPGDTFVSRNAGTVFPENTILVGKVDSVKKASSKRAGQIDVSFVSAELPDGTKIPLCGQLTSLCPNSVSQDPNTGMLMASECARTGQSKFMAYGECPNLLIGEVTCDKVSCGGSAELAAGCPPDCPKQSACPDQKDACDPCAPPPPASPEMQACNTGDPCKDLIKQARGRNVIVPAGTKFGVMLEQQVALSQAPQVAMTPPPPDPAPAPEVAASPPPAPACPACPDTAVAGVTAEPGWKVSFDNVKPVMIGRALLVPIRAVLNGISVPLDYDETTKILRVKYNDSMHVHQIGTTVLEKDKEPIALSIASRIIAGFAFVPVSVVETITGKTSFWSPTSAVLWIR